MIRMNIPGETQQKGAEGEIARNSQAKGPEYDETLESRKAPKKQSRIEENLSGQGQRRAGIPARLFLNAGKKKTGALTSDGRKIHD